MPSSCIAFADSCKLEAMIASCCCCKQLPYAQYQGFTAEAVIVGQKLLLDFEKSGIHLKDLEQREAVQELMARNGHYGALFNHALVSAMFTRGWKGEFVKAHGT